MATGQTTTESRPAYSVFHRWLHWLVAACIAALFATAWMMQDAEGAAGDRLYILHWSFGVIVAVLMTVRVISRLVSPPAPLDVPMPAAQKFAAHAVHGLLYVTLIAQPIVGWAAKSAFGGAISIFGLFDLPPLVERNRALADQLFPVHEVLGIAILVLVGIHIAAVVMHVLKGDGTFARMTTG